MNKLTIIIAVFIFLIAVSNWYSAYSMEDAYVGTVYEHDPSLRANIQSRYDFALVEVFFAVAIIGGAYFFERRGERRDSEPLSQEGQFRE